ncbi:hypothetical protein [Deinococcus aetherius]|nr:hypothetical protein [Deinococcus aetherius]
MSRGDASPEMERLHDAWWAFEELRRCGLDPDRCDALLLRAYGYRDEAVAYRLAPIDRVGELRLQLKNAYFQNLQYEWFSELSRDDVLALLPQLVPASMHWDPNGNRLLVDFVNVALDALPREQAREIYLHAFTTYLQSFGYYARATPEERTRILRDYMWLGRQHLYRSATARENRLALERIIADRLGEEAVALYHVGLDAAREGP